MRIRPYAGIDVSILDNSQQRTHVRSRWCRNVMGLRPSPYNSVKTFLWGEEIIKGNQLDPNNPFRWSKVANDLATDYDDIQLADNSEEMCATVMRCLSTLLTFLGQQDALRKRRPPS
eukprot:13839823-Ditylum_brightwellii.AAC.1